MPKPVETRQQKEQRGFHRVKAPGFLDTEGSFGAAARKNDAHETKLAAVLAALAKFGLLRRKEDGVDPVDELTSVFRAPDMEFGAGPAAPVRKRQGAGAPVQWSDPAGLASSDAAGSLGRFNTPTYGGV